MIIRKPEEKDFPSLKNLWSEAFKDSDAFISAFFSAAFSKNRAMIAEIDGSPVSMLYWFDASFNSKKVAYIYGVATAEGFKKQGICSSLMAALHGHLKASGYVGAVLVPSSENLFNFYKKLGYMKFIYNSQKTVVAEKGLCEFFEISEKEYIDLRKEYLPKNSITQTNLEFLKLQTKFFKGEDFIFSARKEKSTLFALEFLGNKNRQGNIVHCFKAEKGIFRTFGNEKPFAMFLPFEETEIPQYLDFAYD